MSNTSKLTCPACGHKGPHNIHSKAQERYACTKCGRTFSKMSAWAAMAPESLDAPGYVVTCAVSDAYAHKPFLRTLEGYAKTRGFRLLVIPVRYKNPTSMTENPSEWFDPAVLPYIFRGKGSLGENLTVFGDISIQPTAERPLLGLTTLGGGDSVVFGHPKVAFETVATAPGKHAKIAVTTGAVTRPTYSDTKAGKKGEFHHVMGALVVERDGKKFHVRHLLANKDGSFYDLDKRWDEEGWSEGNKAKVLTVGDLHAVRADKDTLDATFFASDSIAHVLKPPHIVLHDVLDFHSASHHNGLHERYRLTHQGKNKVEWELAETARLVDRIAAACPWATIHVVDSNHHRHLTRWLQNLEAPRDVANLKMWLKMNLAVVDGIETGKEVDPFAKYCQETLVHRDRVHFLARNESLMIDRIEYGEHGDKGPNGVKGSPGAFVKVGSKMVVGHGHSPFVMDGVVGVGTSSSYDLGYNPGLSGWLHTHCVTHANAKRTLINVIGQRWRA